MTYGTNKPKKSQSAICEHFLNNLEYSKNYNDNMFFIVCKGNNLYHLSVLDSF